MSHQRVAVSTAQVICGQAFKDFVRDAIGRTQSDFQRGGIGDSGPVRVGRDHPGLLRQPANLVSGPMHQRHRDAQAPQQGDIEQKIPEVVVLDNRPVDGDDKDLVAEARHVTQNLPQVG